MWRSVMTPTVDEYRMVYAKRSSITDMNMLTYPLSRQGARMQATRRTDSTHPCELEPAIHVGMTISFVMVISIPRLNMFLFYWNNSPNRRSHTGRASLG